MLDFASKISDIFSALLAFLAYGKKLEVVIGCPASQKESEKKVEVKFEHQWPKTRFWSIDEHILEIQIANSSELNIPLRRIEWCITDTKISWPIRMRGDQFVEGKLVPQNGLLLYANLERMIPVGLNVLGKNIHVGYRLVKSLKIKVDLVGRPPIYIHAERSLMLLALYVEFKRSIFFNWYQFWLLNK